MVVPADVRGRILHPDGSPRANFKETTRTTDSRVAKIEADRLFRQWKGEIAEARLLGAGPVADLPAVLAAIDNWRRDKCGAAADFAAALEEERMAAGVADMRAMMAELAKGPIYFQAPDLSASKRPREPLQPDALDWAKRYFASERGRGQNRGTGLPFVVGTMLGRAQEAERDRDAWAKVPNFDGEFDAAVKAGGLTTTIPARVRETARQPFARAWREVLQAEEHERHRAAVILATFESSTSSPATIRVEGRPEATYVAREGDVTVGEAIEAFRRTQADPALYQKQYGHVGRALDEVLGADKPMRAVSRQDVREVLQFLHTLPTNASKIYPGLPLAEAAERAAQEGRKLLAQNTVRSYMIALNSICAFSVEEGWADANPVERQIPSKADQVQRRAFTSDELRALFGALVAERRADAARWWIPAILAFSGARANEICQLYTEDVKEVDGVPHIDLQAFDEAGNRIERRRLKNEPSKRAIPIHPELVAAGFIEFVARRRTAGGEQLFPELRPNIFGYFSHDISRWFGRHCDAVGLTEPALCLHSLRHGFKDAGDTVRLPEYILEALGGWASKGSQMRRYGGRCSPARVKENADHIALIRLGDFTLGVPPNAT